MNKRYVFFHVYPPRLRGVKRSAVALGWVLLLSAYLPACAVKGVPVQTPVTTPETFAQSGQAVMPDRWWTAFEVEGLDALVEEALTDNFDLRTAWDRFDQARAIAVKAGADLYPDLNASGSLGRSVTRRANAGGRSYATDFSLGLSVSYEVDLWGRVRSGRDAAALDAMAAAEDVSAAAISLSAEIVQLWCRLTELHGELKLLDQQIETNEKHLAIVELKFSRGQVGAADVLQQQQTLEAVKGDRLLVESDIEVKTHQLTVLIGKSPGEVEFVFPETLPATPPLPRTGLVTDLLRRRPDIRSAELAIQSVDRSVASAIADRFPRLSITARGETFGNECRDLFDNWLANIAGNLVAPIIDGGQRRAEVERLRASLSARINEYGQIILVSVQEVADALSQEAKQAEYVASLQQQLDFSWKAADQTLATYQKTGGDFVRYLTTLLAHQRLQRTYLQAQRDLMLFRIDLYRALAGGFDLTRPDRQTVSGPKSTVGYDFEKLQPTPAEQAKNERS